MALPRTSRKCPGLLTGAGGALLVTGPTGTNVNDLRVALVSGTKTERTVE